MASISKRTMFNSQNLQYRCHHGPNLWSEENVQKVIDQWQLSPEQEARLRKLGKRVADVDHFKNDPQILIRFLRGPWGHKEAERMFRKMIAWRKQNSVDTIFDDYVPPQVLLDCVPSAVLKDWDKDGDPIYLERGGAVDANGLLKMFSFDELIRHGIWTRERNTNGIWMNDFERHGRLIKGITVIYDCQGLSAARHLTPRAIEYFKLISKITSENFPNPIKKLFVIRAPKIFTVFWSLVKHFFPASARAKMVIVGNTGYLDVLEKYMDLSVLPPCIYEGGSGGPARGMMQDLDGVESLQAYLNANYPSKDSQSTVDTDVESLCSESSNHLVEVRGKVIMRGSWR